MERSILTRNSSLAATALSLAHGVEASTPCCTIGRSLYQMFVFSSIILAPEYPSAHIIRPQFGSPPAQPHWTGAEFPTASAARRASPAEAPPCTSTSTNRETPS